MKNTSLLISIISLVAVIAFGVIVSVKDGGKKAEAPTEGEAVETAVSEGAIVYIDRTSRQRLTEEEPSLRRL